MTVKVFALVMAADLGRIHSGGVLLSKHAKTIPVEFRLCVRVTEVTLVNVCWKFGPPPPQAEPPSTTFPLTSNRAQSPEFVLPLTVPILTQLLVEEQEYNGPLLR